MHLLFRFIGVFHLLTDFFCKHKEQIIVLIERSNIRANFGRVWILKIKKISDYIVAQSFEKKTNFYIVDY